MDNSKSYDCCEADTAIVVEEAVVAVDTVVAVDAVVADPVYAE